jgi:hypothetical protein
MGRISQLIGHKNKVKMYYNLCEKKVITLNIKLEYDIQIVFEGHINILTYVNIQTQSEYHILTLKAVNILTNDIRFIRRDLNQLNYFLKTQFTYYYFVGVRQVLMITLKF